MRASQLKAIGASGLLVLALAGFVFAVRGRERTEPYVPPTPDAQHWIHKAASEDVTSQCVGLQKLGEMRAPEGIPTVIAQLRSARVAVRVAAVRSLVRYANASSVEPLIEALKDREPLVKVGAMEALGGIGDVRAFEPLRAQIVPKAQGYYAARAIARLKTPKAEDALIEALGSPDPQVRLGGIDGLAECGRERGAAALRLLLARPLDGIDAELIGELRYQATDPPTPDVLAEPARRALDAIEKRLKKEKEATP